MGIDGTDICECYVTLGLRSVQHRPRRPTKRGLTVQISDRSAAGLVIRDHAIRILRHLRILVGSHADFPDFAVFVEVPGQCDPRLASGLLILRRWEPTLLYAGGHRE